MTDPLRIVCIRLTDEAPYTKRWLQSEGKPDTHYPVILGLTRKVTPFEEVELASKGFQVLKEPPWGRDWVVTFTNVEYLRKHIKDVEDKLAAAVNGAALTAEFAAVEDQKIKDLAEEINSLLKQADAQEERA
ncbi:hypothetical protein SBI67_17820 [Mycolicibacterium sp. 120266]|uniref:hypothetical protein n=1 Tax=Mycolicibacterium sp. 120266 TaxID=3090601 RepID=UPI00299F38F4|nr:hypothetical protein [Mycolicibacterium sp. 120266]MDX1873983.1 hypothetical protein [Mycolicibacterium sp. 120266]